MTSHHEDIISNQDVEIEELKHSNKEKEDFIYNLMGTIKSAMRIQELWAPVGPDDVTAENECETMLAGEMRNIAGWRRRRRDESSHWIKPAPKRESVAW